MHADNDIVTRHEAIHNFKHELRHISQTLHSYHNTLPFVYYD